MAEDGKADATRTAITDEYATVPQEPNLESLQFAQLTTGSWPIHSERYESVKLLGEGAMGSVYLARDTQLGRQVALKIPKFDPDSPTAILRFQREARVMATLRHANLCSVYDVGELDGIHFLTMAYIPGRTLADHLTAGKPLPAREVTLLILKLAQAVGEAHRCGVVHRDLKPANIIIDQRREPVVMDFGLAGLADGKSSLTNPGSMIGTPAYMSPEQVRGDLRAIGPASDVYSLGAIMYQMLTGSPPFEGSIASIVRQALADRPECPSSLDDGVDPQLGAICLRALAKSPAERFASGDEFAIVLREYLKGPKPTPVEVNRPAREPTPQHLRQAEEIRQHWQRGNYEAALPLLEYLAATTNAEAAAYSRWAQRELPKVREKLELLAAHQDFLQVAHVSLPPLVSRPPSNRQDQNIPKWLIWVMATPACVLVFLTVIVLAGWKNASPLTELSPPMTRPANRAGEYAAAAAGQSQVSLDGYCPVALVERREWILGDRKWDAVHEGHLYLFSSPEAQQKFLANPTVFAPLWAGYDPVRYAESGVLVPGRREFGLYIDEPGPIALFADEAALERFHANSSHYLNLLRQAQASGRAEPISSRPPLIPEGATALVADDATPTPMPVANDASIDRDVGPPPQVEPVPESAVPPPRNPPSYEQLLDRHDANENDLLEVDEIPSPHRERLKQADANDDGILSRQEVGEFHSRQPPRP